jgi:hypothetical protein
MLGLIVVAIALAVALRSGGRAVGASYQRRMDAWAAEHPDATRIHRRGAALGQMIATLRYGPGALKHGFRTGWKEGWESGKNWAAKHKPVQPAAEVTPTPEPAPAQPAQAAPRLRADGRPDLRVAPPTQNTPPAAPAATPKKGSQDMAIETATGGEVTSPEMLKAELETKVSEHAADLEDAKADAARGAEEVKRTELLTASVKKLKLPAADIALVSKLLEPATARLDAANRRVQAAEMSLAGAKAALTMAGKHVQMVGQAAGGFYGN